MLATADNALNISTLLHSQHGYLNYNPQNIIIVWSDTRCWALFLKYATCKLYVSLHQLRNLNEMITDVMHFNK